MPEEKFTPEQSLRVIQSMIDQTKKNFSDNSFYFIFWGWLVFFTALAEYVLMVWVKYPQHYLVWNLMWIGAIVSIVYGIRRERKEKVKTHIDETTKYIGIATGIMFTILSFIITCYKMWEYSFPLYFLLYGFLSFINGVIIGFAPLRWAGIICWAISIVSVFVKFEIHLLLMALVMIVSFIIPGHLLYARHKKQNS